MASKPTPVLPVRHIANGTYEVGSATEPGKTYDVDLTGPICNCEAGQRGNFCIHVKAAREAYQAEQVQMAMELNGVAKHEEKPKVKGRRQTQLDKLGYQFGEVTSAMQKEIRRGDEEAAVYWGLLLYEASPYYAWKRVLITAAEDVGFAAPETVALVYSLALGWQFCKTYSYTVPGHSLTMAIMALCRTPYRDTQVEDLQSLTLEMHKRGLKREMEDYSRDAHTEAGRAAGKNWSHWYFDRHATFGIPVNDYARRLWEIEPDWKPEGVE